MRPDLPLRRSGLQVRRQPIRRASPRLRGAQMYSLVLMFMCLMTAISLSGSPAFEARHLLVNGARFTGEPVVRAIGCEGFARVDFLLDGNDLFLNEINTIPGFTPISLFPQMAATGLGSFGAVCRRIVELAEQRQAARVKRRLTTADLPR